MFADTHCHLCAGLDDGPSSIEEALDMCRIAWNDGTRVIACTVHQNRHWPEVTTERIIAASQELKARLAELSCPLELVPTAEVIVEPDLIEKLRDGELLGDSPRPQLSGSIAATAAKRVIRLM